MRKSKKGTFIRISIFTSLITSGWVLLQHLKARKLQSELDGIPHEMEEKHRRAGWFTKYQGR